MVLWSTVWGGGAGELRPKPARSQAQIRVFSATLGWTLYHWSLQSPEPAVRITTGLPRPMHIMWIVRPSGSRAESLVLA